MAVKHPAKGDGAPLTIYLLAAGLLEIVWATAFKLSDGLGRL
jgi:multidrug transporter EmrE-like cation transporter